MKMRNVMSSTVCLFIMQVYNSGPTQWTRFYTFLDEPLVQTFLVECMVADCQSVPVGRSSFHADSTF